MVRGLLVGHSVSDSSMISGSFLDCCCCSRQLMLLSSLLMLLLTARAAAAASGVSLKLGLYHKSRSA